MIEQLNEISTDRVIFKSGKQREFIINAKLASGSNWTVFARMVKIDFRLLSEYRKEKYSLSVRNLNAMLRLSKLSVPRDIKIRKQFWSVQKAGKVGGKITYEKYGSIGGNQENRKKKWLKWWNKHQINNLGEFAIAKTVSFPRKNPDLAEFVGIMLGDGNISTYQIRISLNRITDKKYSRYVTKLIKKIFFLTPAVYDRPDSSIVDISISRKNIIEFLIHIGLKRGNKTKHQIDIPKWIKENGKLASACVRGLMDTDGCIYNEKHTINSVRYYYPRISFVNASKPLLHSVYQILKDMDFSPKIRNNRSINVEQRADIVRYFEIIDSSNPKHKTRFRLFRKQKLTKLSL